MQSHCCQKLISTLQEFNTPLVYDPQTRSYLMQYHSSIERSKKNGLIVCETLRFCPFCGKEFPLDLHDKLFEILEQEYTTEGLAQKVRAGNVPEEFKTDAWWKNRGL